MNEISVRCVSECFIDLSHHGLVKQGFNKLGWVSFVSSQDDQLFMSDMD